MPTFTTRPELAGTFGMVASTRWLASQAGMAALAPIGPSGPLHLGNPLAISAVIAGDWPRGTTLTVAADGSTTSTRTRPDA